MSAELKPCPFCGDEAEAGGYAIAPDGYWASCQTCGVCQEGYTRKEDAIAAWNTRATDSRITSMEEALEAWKAALQDIADAEPIPNVTEAFAFCRDVARAALSIRGEG